MDAEPSYRLTDGKKTYELEGRFHVLRVLDDGEIDTVSVGPAWLPPLSGKVTVVDFETPAVTVSTSAPLPTGKELAGQPIMFHDSAWPKNSIFTIKMITPIEGVDEYVIALEDCGFESAVGTIDKINTEEGWIFTKDSLEKLFNCHYLYDGKALYTDDRSQWFRIDTARAGYFRVGDVTIRFKDKAAAKAFQPGDKFWIMDVSPGAEFHINQVMAAKG